MKGDKDNARTDPALQSMRAVLRSPLPKVHKAVLISLLSRAKWSDEHAAWRCWPSYSTIASDCSMSRAAIAGALKDLRGSGLYTSTTDPEVCASAVYELNLNAIRSLRKRNRGEGTFESIPKDRLPPEET